MNLIKAENENRMLTTAKSACVLVHLHTPYINFRLKLVLYMNQLFQTVKSLLLLDGKCQAASTLRRQFGSFIFIAASYHYPCNLYSDPFNALIIVLKLLAVFELVSHLRVN